MLKGIINKIINTFFKNKVDSYSPRKQMRIKHVNIPISLVRQFQRIEYQPLKDVAIRGSLLELPQIIDNSIKVIDKDLPQRKYYFQTPKVFPMFVASDIRSLEVKCEFDLQQCEEMLNSILVVDIEKLKEAESKLYHS